MRCEGIVIVERKLLLEGVPHEMPGTKRKALFFQLPQAESLEALTKRLIAGNTAAALVLGVRTPYEVVASEEPVERYVFAAPIAVKKDDWILYRPGVKARLGQEDLPALFELLAADPVLAPYFSRTPSMDIYRNWAHAAPTLNLKPQ